MPAAMALTTPKRHGMSRDEADGRDERKSVPFSKTATSAEPPAPPMAFEQP